MDPSEIARRLAEIACRVEELEARIGEARAEAREARRRSAELRRRAEEIIDRIVSLEAEIRRLAGKAREIRAEMRRLAEERRRLAEELRRCGEVIRERPRLPAPYEDLKREVEGLELKYETTSMDRRREKVIVERINRLYAMIRRYERYVDALRRRDELRRALERMGSDDLRGELRRVGGEMEKMRGEVARLREEAKRLLREAREEEARAREAERRAMDMDMEVRRLVGEAEEILRPLGLSADARSLRRIAELVRRHEDLLSSVLRKRAAGEPLSFDEFALLVRYGLLEGG